MQKANLKCLISLFVLIYVCVFVNPFVSGIMAGESKQNIFTTWNVFEVDKCASIWLITRFIDQNAVIKIIPKGETPTEGVSFDIPDAKFKRSFNRSTYESLLQYYNLSDPKLIKIGKIVHDVEINIWEKKRYSESRDALEAINSLIMQTKDNNEILERSKQYFDTLYERIEVETVSQ